MLHSIAAPNSTVTWTPTKPCIPSPLPLSLVEFAVRNRPICSYGVQSSLCLVVFVAGSIGLLGAETQSIHGKIKLTQVDAPPSVSVEQVEDLADL